MRFVPGGLGRPVWVDDPHFNLDYHVRHSALPPPGAEHELDTLMGRVMSQELDRHRPLWEVWMVEGLPDGRWAIISKVHHCMVDGVSGTDLMACSSIPSRRRRLAAPDRWTPAPEPSDAALVARAARAARANPDEQLRAVARARRGRRDAALASATTRFRRCWPSGSELRPARRCRSRARSDRTGAGPRHASTSHEIKAIRPALGGTVNDVVLTAITGAFRDLLLRDAGTRSRRRAPFARTRLGPARPVTAPPNNQVSAMIAELPVGIADPLERLAAMRRQMAELKESHQVVAGEAITSLAGFAPPTLLALGAAARPPRWPGGSPAQRQHCHHERAWAAVPAVRRGPGDGRVPAVRAARPRACASAWRYCRTTAG